MSFIPNAITHSFFELQTPDFAWSVHVDRSDKMGIPAKKKLHGIHERKIQWTMELAITQTFFELQTPDFEWKFIWIVSANIKQNANLQIKVKKCKKHKKYKKMNLKFGRRYRSSYIF